MAKDPLLNLADALVEDLLATPDEEILAEASEEELAEAMKIRERALEAAHNGGLSAFGAHVLGFSDDGCEDQGMMPTSTCVKFGCDNATLTKQGRYWCCPRCGSSYGEDAHGARS